MEVLQSTGYIQYTRLNDDICNCFTMLIPIMTTINDKEMSDAITISKFLTEQ